MRRKKVDLGSSLFFHPHCLCLSLMESEAGSHVHFLSRKGREEKMPALRSLGVAGSWDDEIGVRDDE
ncbi:MAG: hypothetical protein WC612_06780 [Bdellovibrionales bacterium]